MDDSELVDSTPISSGQIQPALPDDPPQDGSGVPDVGDPTDDRPEVGAPDVRPEVGEPNPIGPESTDDPEGHKSVAAGDRPR